MDLFGPTRTTSLGGMKYGLVIVDDFSRYTWVLFITHKDETFNVFKKFYKRVTNLKNLSVISIRSDHGTEFENQYFDHFCTKHGIDHNFSAPRTPQQNGVVERKNRTLEEMSRTMLCEGNLPKYFWAEAVNNACYILNRVLIRTIIRKTPYELWNNIKPNIKYFHVFGCKYFVLNNGKDNLGKFDAKSDEAIFLGYSLNSKAYRVFNKRTLTVEESIYVVFNESDITSSRKEDFADDDAGTLEHGMKDLTLKDKQSSEPHEEEVSKNHDDIPKEWRYVQSHPKELIIGDPSQGVKTRSAHRDAHDLIAFVSHVEPHNIEEAETDPNWMLAMHDELNQFRRNNVWTLVERPNDHPVIGTKWVYRNKLDEDGNVIRNKARLVT